ncbi:MAG: ribbon-helix-helix protein, CopG family [Acidobacteria bacterium]|nr:ribbon-helix-helix protein, CopG family [Acidobacteriota bacterium]
MATLTVRLDDRLDAQLREVVARTGGSRSAFVREAICRQLAVARLEELRCGVASFAEARGWSTDEDVFSEVS